MVLCKSRTLIEILPIAELYETYNTHHRLKVFVQKGRECVVCGRYGAILAATRDKGGDIHIDVFTEDFVMLTVDHVTPKAVCRRLGWTKDQMKDMSNKQPMCSQCNSFKADKELSLEQLRERRCRYGYPQVQKSMEVLRRLVAQPVLFGVKIQSS